HCQAQRHPRHYPHDQLKCPNTSTSTSSHVSVKAGELLLGKCRHEGGREGGKEKEQTEGREEEEE
ncbi:hypothetical protein Pmani_036780, partial [Petrolisthes manimaculis]